MGRFAVADIAVSKRLKHGQFENLYRLVNSINLE